MSASTPRTGTAATPAVEVVWLPFAGTAERRGSTFRLTARNGNGSVELGAHDVGFDRSGRPYVRKGAVLIHVDEPWHRDVRDKASTPRCASGPTACVGSVLIRCGDFRAIGTTTGSWGCEKAGFEP